MSVNKNPIDKTLAEPPLNPVTDRASGEKTDPADFPDSAGLERLEQAFRVWVKRSSNQHVLISRRRIFLIFLLIRYTGARLSEVLALDLSKDVDSKALTVRFGANRPETAAAPRDVHISSVLLDEIRDVVEQTAATGKNAASLRVDAGHIRRKFYERALECGFPQELGSPNSIRRGRTAELMGRNIPLPVVQRMLGHATPNLAASLARFSDEEMARMAKSFIARETQPKTSARNTFFGKVSAITEGDVQSVVEFATLGGDILTAVITNNSLRRLELIIGSLVIAEVKAPWVMLDFGREPPTCSAENIFAARVTNMLRGRLVSEITAVLRDGAEVCSVMTHKGDAMCGIRTDDHVWVMFNGFAVTLHLD